MPAGVLTSWGRVLRSEQDVVAPVSRYDALPACTDDSSTLLPYGNGRSYGDVCLNPGGTAIKTRGMDRYIAFDADTGVLRCEAGVLLAEVLALAVPRGWFLPVTPGTRFITLGGAVANDVHGKNHHVAGTFGRHVRCFELLRSDGVRRLCSPAENPALFAATLGGLGLTGLVTWVELQLRRIAHPWLLTETIRYGNLAEFFALAAESDRTHEYTVSWVDCAGSGRQLGRGLFSRGNHAPAEFTAAGGERPAYRSRSRTFPLVPPVSLVNALTLRAFNALYYRRQCARAVTDVSHYEPFFYPLDGILEWNRLYGPRGFYQYQCVIPAAQGHDAIAALLAEIARSGQGSFLAVLKVCGDVPSPGLLSFPLPGVSLALDFPARGDALTALFARLDAVVADAGGRLYPAKDACMSGRMFRAGYPRWQEFSTQIDPHFSSAFWRRVMEDA